MKINLKNIFYLLYIFFINPYTLTSMEEINVYEERNWRKSLNYEFEDYENNSIPIDSWINSTKYYISEEYKNKNIQPLMDENIKTCNIATAQFRLIFKNQEETDNIYTITLSPSEGKVSLSGQKKFKDDISKNIILSGRNFDINKDSGFVYEYNHDYNEIRNRCDYIKEYINRFLNYDIVKDGGHSEAYILLRLIESFPTKILDNLLSYNKNIIVIGTIFTFSSLKDPCQRNCFPMLNYFNSQLPLILKTYLQSPSIKILDNFERIILIGAKDPHFEQISSKRKSTRDFYSSESNTFNEKIIIDFNNPKCRVFSATFEDLQ